MAKTTYQGNRASSGSHARRKPGSLPHKVEGANANPLLERLIRKGGITFGTGKPLSRKPPARLKPGKSIAEMVAEDRR